MLKVSVIIPIYNAELYLKQALDSIVNQTIKEIEIICIDDFSTDKSFEIVKGYAQKDARIIALKNDKNLGLVGTLNRGLCLAKGEFIARMDNDDISELNRFEIQLDFLSKNPNVGICGSAIKKIGKVNRTVKLPTSPEAIKANLCFNCCIMHPTVMIRADLLQKHNLKYDPKFDNCEDFEFWTRCIQFCNIANIQKPLLNYRVHSKSISNLKEKEQKTKALEVIKKQFERYFNTEFDETKLALLFDEQKLDMDSYSDFTKIYTELIELNSKFKAIDIKWFEFYLRKTATKTLNKKFKETRQLFYLKKMFELDKIKAIALFITNFYRIKL